jgi:hypothetical protein
MEIKKITPEMKALLQAPLPKEAVKKHPTKTYLSSIKAIYVVERLNQVFGIGSWKLKSSVINDKSSMIVVSTCLTIPEYGIELESFGGNDNGGENSKNFDLGDAYKGATTDALTKICSYLEIGMDVFKGFSNENQPPQATAKPVFDKNHPAFKNSHKAISEGTKTIEGLQKVFQVSEETIKILTSKYND